MRKALTLCLHVGSPAPGSFDCRAHSTPVSTLQPIWRCPSWPTGRRSPHAFAPAMRSMRDVPSGPCGAPGLASLGRIIKCNVSGFPDGCSSVNFVSAEGHKAHQGHTRKCEDEKIGVVRAMAFAELPRRQMWTQQEVHSRPVCVSLPTLPLSASPSAHWAKRAGTSPVNAVVRETILERQVHFQSSD